MAYDRLQQPNAARSGIQRLRIILAGRTGLDAALRKDPHVELIRARNAHEALGELADPIDNESPEQAVIIVGADVAAGLNGRELASAAQVIRPGTPSVLAAALPIGGSASDPRFDAVVGTSAGADDVRHLVARWLSQLQGHSGAQAVMHSGISAVPVAQAGHPQAGHPQAGHPQAGQASVQQSVMFTGFSGPMLGTGSVSQAEVVGAQFGSLIEPPRPVAPPVVRHVAHEPARRELAGQAPVGMRSSGDSSTGAGPMSGGTQPLTPPALPATAPATWNEDRAVVAALLRGSDVLEPALASIRQRLGRSDVAFVGPGYVGSGVLDAGVAARADQPSTPQGAQVAVTHAGRTLGQLTSISLPASRLEPAATWLGEVLALRDELGEARISAITDELTGAFNRRYLTRFLAHAISDSARRRCMVSVMIFDIDLFKGYNDRLGHVAGDELLKEVVRLLKSMVRPDDRVCRIGGDEFVVVFYEPSGPREPNTRHPDSVEAIAQRFQTQIAQHRFPKLGPGLPVRLTVSGGLATFPWDGRTPDELIARADAKLLEAKRQGRNALIIG